MATVTTRIGLADNGARMTLEEFEDAEFEEGYRYELARGVLEVTQVPNDPHRQVVTNLYRGVGDYDRQHPRTILSYGGGAEFQLWLPTLVSGRNPDLGVVLKNAPKDDRGRRQPVLVAEVVSEGGEDRDYVVKKEEYLAFGILEYWIVDLMLRKFTFLWRRGDAWGERVIKDAEVIPSLVLPGLTLIVADLWTDLDFENDDQIDRA